MRRKDRISRVRKAQGMQGPAYVEDTTGSGVTVGKHGNDIELSGYEEEEENQEAKKLREEHLTLLRVKESQNTRAGCKSSLLQMGNVEMRQGRQSGEGHHERSGTGLGLGFRWDLECTTSTVVCGWR